MSGKSRGSSRYCTEVCGRTLQEPCPVVARIRSIFESRSLFSRSQIRLYSSAIVSRAAGSNVRANADLVHHFLLRQLGFVRTPDLGDGGLLFLGHRLALDSLFCIFLTQPLHGNFVGTLWGSIGHNVKIPFPARASRL